MKRNLFSRFATLLLAAFIPSCSKSTSYNGGTTFPESMVIKTIYSVVVKPAGLKLWLKVREYSGWEEIDLKKYFSNR